MTASIRIRPPANSWERCLARPSRTPYRRAGRQRSYWKERCKGMEEAESWEETREKLRQQIRDLPDQVYPIYHPEARLRVTPATMEQVVEVHAVMVEAF